MTPETPQAGKRNTAKAGNKAGGGASPAGAPGTAVDQTAGTGTESVSASAAASRDSDLGSTNGDGHSARGLVNQIRQKATSQINEQKNRATDGLGGVAQAVRESTQQLRAQHYDTVADMVERAADQIERFSNNLRERDLDQIVADAQDLARKNPSVFIGASFAAGLVAARFVKASRPDSSYGRDYSGSSDSWRGSESRSMTDANRTGTGDAFGRPQSEIRGRGEL
jgi:ElaB/YqjD/DUF883 family membrane-anchored ribosome-binding protein